MKNIKFSIIMCIKDGEKYINEQIESIINQDFKNWELLIIDDCSKDNSLKIAKNYAEFEKRISLKQNLINFGIKNNFLINSFLQKGEWIVFCDQDDIWELNKLSYLNYYIENNNKFNLFFHNGSYLIDDDNKTFRGAFGKMVINREKVYKNKPNLNFLNLLFSNKIIGCFLCINKEFLKKFVTLIPSASIYHDHWVAIISSIYSEIYFIDKDLIKYRRHGKTNTLRNKFIKKIYDRLLLIFSIFLNHCNLLIGKNFRNKGIF